MSRGDGGLLDPMRVSYRGWWDPLRVTDALGTLRYWRPSDLRRRVASRPMPTPGHLPACDNGKRCGGPHCPPADDWHDPTHGRIDRDIQEHVDWMQPTDIGQRVALENTLQTMRDGGADLAILRGPDGAFRNDPAAVPSPVPDKP